MNILASAQGLRQRITTLLLVVTILLASVGSSYQTASAGSNGQMILAANACARPATITWIRITGTNEKGKTVTWEKRPNDNSTLTSGYRWVGMVSIDWRISRDTYLHRTNAVIPRKYQRDYSTVLLDKWGCG